jgi:hypothetical protein
MQWRKQEYAAFSRLNNVNRRQQLTERIFVFLSMEKDVNTFVN